MARMDHQHANSIQRSKRALLTAAAAELPRTTRAAFNGTCNLCHHGYQRGARILHTQTGWAHARCTTNPPPS